ncbi:Acyl-CoA N-acyltransferase [Metarhizium rileyi]|uniref:Acyl-CoA N-acyltransferase n=1 Tax=Metarhizium rileyi (strain RCEF 4871) TaxID=1649241 RepID=A0A167GAP9_METRR|nr:Acyl-CoA N-acyltransferase [Metarhizium rileyi RCEF 4871]
MDSVALQFRLASLADAPQIQQLVEAAFRADDSRRDWTGNVELASAFRLTLDEVRAKLANPDLITLVAHDARVPASLIASIDVSRHDGGGRLSMLAVHVSHQKGGLGSRVIAYAEDYCRRVWHVRKFSLNALCNRTALIQWYMRRGYEKTGTSKFPTERFAELDLPDGMCFIELEKKLEDSC